jgi:hypothetical protein
MPLKQYRKLEEKYYDSYDRYTIELLKEIELEEKKKYPKTISYNGETYTINEGFPIKLHDRGVQRARDREETVKKWVFEDEEKDRIVERHKIPEAPKCDTCGTRNYLNGHVFDFYDNKFLFVFDCPTGEHKSRKIVHPSGDVLIFPKPKCKKCGGELISSTKKKKNLLISKDKCKSCKHTDSFEYDLTPDKPITEDDRKKYCEYYKGKRTFKEDLEAIANLKHIFNEQETEKLVTEEISKIEKLTVPKIKERLLKVANDSGFLEFQTEKPDFGRNVIIEFSVQDPSSHTGKESVKILCKAFNKSLFHTNWRLQNNGVSYRLGYLTGKLKAYESDEDLLKLAKEIKDKAKISEKQDN